MDSYLQIRGSALSRTLLIGICVYVAAGCTGRNPDPGEASPQPTDAVHCTPSADLTTAEETAYLGEKIFSGKACTRYKNGSLHTLTTYAEGKKEGAWKMYYPDGTLMKEGGIKNGKDEGVYREYFPDGTPKYAYRYRNGLKTGVWKSWYSDGTQYTERHFEEDKLHGKVLVWDEQGTLAKEYDYRRGKLVHSKMHFEE